VNPIASTARQQSTPPELVEALKKYALKIEPVILSSGEKSDYYVDVKQAMLRPGPARIVGPLIARIAHELKASTVGGLVQGAIPVACAAIACDEGNDLTAFFIRKQQKKHGRKKRIEGPEEHLQDGAPCLIVDDVVTKGGSTVEAIEFARDEGLDVVGAVAVMDRLAGGRERIEAELGSVPFISLATIDDIHPERSDRG
jgi:orotate phosphoribosyltransferase